MIYTPHLRSLIRATLSQTGLNSSPSAVNLLLGTAAQESGYGTYLYQMGSGPARGIFQIEPRTEIDNWDNWINFRPFLKQQIQRVTGLSGPNELALAGNMIYGIIHARIKYRRAPGALPDPGDIPGLAAYWKEHYNTLGGKGRPAEFIENYNRFVLR